MSLPVFRVAPDVLTQAAPGASIDAGNDAAGHAVRVRRMRVGEKLELVDGLGTRVRGAITAAAADALTVRADAVTRDAPSAPALVLVQALAKGDRDLQAVEAACEVGIDAVVPWAASRSIADWPAKKAQRMAKQWDNLLVAASLQSRRATFPTLEPLVRATAFVSLLQPGDHMIVLDEAAAVPLPQALETLGLTQRGAPGTGLGADQAPAPGSGSDPAPVPPAAEAQAGQAIPARSRAPRLFLVVGPEGGITDAERAAAASAGALTAVLGPTVLRASTAGPVATALMQTLLGRWRGTDAARG